MQESSRAGTTNRDWWPNQPNLSALHRNPPIAAQGEIDMALPETRLKLAVRAVERALPAAATPDRLTAFRTAYAALAKLNAGDDAWTAETLDAAWTLASDGWPRDIALAAVLEDVGAAHAVIVDAASPGRPKITRPRAKS